MAVFMKNKFLLSVALAASVAIGWYSGATPALRIPVVVYHDADCRCCERWAEHMKANDFQVVEQVASPLQIQAIREELQVPSDLTSCHVARVGNQFIVGHVPADTVYRLLRDSRGIQGVGVSGMPLGSPGMDAGSRVEPYEVVAVFSDGASAVYERR